MTEAQILTAYNERLFEVIDLRGRVERLERAIVDGGRLLREVREEIQRRGSEGRE